MVKLQLIVVRTVRGRYADVRPAAATIHNNTLHNITKHNTCTNPDGIGTVNGFDLEKIYQEYPKRFGANRKAAGFQKLKKLLKGGDDYTLALQAVCNYKLHCESRKIIGSEFVKQFASFFDSNGDWKEWVNYNPETKKQNDDQELMKILGD